MIFSSVPRQARGGITLLLAAATLIGACGRPTTPSPSATATGASSSGPASAPAAAPSPPVARAPIAGPSPAASPSASPSPAAALALPKPAAVPGYPSKPIEIVVPFAPGGGFDALARQLAIPMQQELGQPVVVKNVPGGGTRIGARTFQQAPADGHTLGYFADNGLYTSQLVTPPEGFDLKSWVWAAGVRVSPIAIYVGKDSPFKTIQDVMAAERNGQQIRIPHNGLGGGFLVSDVIFTSAVGWKNYTLVGGYQGTADLVPALVRGDIDIAIISPVSSVISFVRSGDIRPLVVFSNQHNPLIPDVPSVVEAGLPNADQLNVLGSTYGFAVAPGTPPERLAILEAAIINGMKDPGFLQWAEKTGAVDDLRPTPGAEMTRLKQQEYQLYDRYAEEFRKYS